MKTIGIIGGMSWESSSEYYKIINETVRENLGGIHSAKVIMYSIDQYENQNFQNQGKWDELTSFLIDIAQKIEASGADFIIISTNTIHKFADKIQENIGIPILHIMDYTAQKIKERKIKKIGLLGTRCTMEEDFYKGRLKERYGITTVIPSEKDREIIQHIIFDELCCGKLKDSSREQIKRIIEKLVLNGAEGIILGCTEIPLLIKQKDVNIPIFDTTTIHAKAAAKYALKE